MNRYNIILLQMVLFLSQINYSSGQEYPFPEKDDFKESKPGVFVIHEDSLKGYKADFGLLSVPESRTDSGSELIYLPFVRVYSSAEQKSAPLFLFEGGPGLSNINFNYFPAWLLENHDIIRVGYRGVDGSVSLHAPEINQMMKSLPDGLTGQGLKEIGTAISQAAKRLQDKGIKLQEYTIQDVVDDMEDARKAFGFEKINLSGGSYGGAVVYTYCTKYPQSIHRAILSESAFPFDLALTSSDFTETTLKRLNKLWQNDMECRKKSEDITETIRNVLKTLPQNRNGIRITEDKMRLMIFFGLYQQSTTAQVFDAFIAAERDNDYSGLAFMSFYWDQLVDTFNWGDLIAKTYPTRVSTFAEIQKTLGRKNSLIGTPLSEIAWGPLPYTEWPVKEQSAGFNPSLKSDVEVLFIYGSKESAGTAQQEYLPNFKNGHIVIYENLGHMDVGLLQPEASRHMEKEFFNRGIVDQSKFDKETVQTVNFKPEVSFQDMAKQYMQQQQNHK
ncbi:MAG: alpha/beta hydrolase [Chlorobi bacterium]|nr:alpha/beta hydrolase [Chlorobiota bacterium]